ncbi:hypothetical protein ROA7745_03492 [Roseovarius aestuarii]|uniref:Uncharacterized protein n=1 Tax=Roseovarius aestuarii TaxID=475083 RepID=A0A1X7BVU7_9RHOB|nr:hypothetical protein ROA7745_03492 [Roseovarius aestuarii]
MKQRWLKSVIKNSKTQETALPFQRTMRRARKNAASATVVKELKTA